MGKRLDLAMDRRREQARLHGRILTAISLPQAAQALAGLGPWQYCTGRTYRGCTQPCVRGEGGTNFCVCLMIAVRPLLDDHAMFFGRYEQLR